MGVKAFQSAGGQVEILLPDHWVEEVSGNGKVFYEPREGSGTLRLDVLTFQVPAGTDSRQAIERVSVREGVAPRTLASGVWAVAKESDSEDEAGPVRSWSWTLAMVEGTTLVSPIFSFSVALGQVSTEENVRDLGVVTEAVEGAVVRVAAGRSGWRRFLPGR